MNNYDVVILGAGASGMVAAIKLAQGGKSVALIERQMRGGKKILASGNGRCNISNSSLSAKNFYINNKKLIQELLKSYSLADIKAFFVDLGLELIESKDKRLFPQSMSAASVLNLLEERLKSLNITLFFGAEELKVTRGFTFVFNNKKITSNALIIATGSEAAPQLGGSSSGLEIAKSFGHKIIKPLPALVPLVSNSAICKRLTGLKLPAKVHLFVDGAEQNSKSGDLLFTKYGVSGLSILDISIAAVKALSLKKSTHLKIDFFPTLNKKELFTYLQNRLDKNRNLSMPSWLGAIIHPKLAFELLKSIDMQTLSENQMKATHIKALVEQLKALSIEIENYRPMQYAEVTLGGVDSNEVDYKTLESKKLKNLYFCGEVLDTIGDRGGYNFHFAWCSAFMVAKALLRQ